MRWLHFTGARYPVYARNGQIFGFVYRSMLCTHYDTQAANPGAIKPEHTNPTRFSKGLAMTQETYLGCLDDVDVYALPAGLNNGASLSVVSDA
jgi:hypothetical protein